MRKLFIKKKNKITLKVKYRITQIFLIIFMFLFGTEIYFNYDYIVFKILICSGYIYTDTLNDLYKDFLKEENTENYYKNFDDLIIALTTSAFYSKSDDPYTYIYLPEEYIQSKNKKKEVAEKSEIKQYDDNIVYLKLTNFSKYSKDFIFDNIKKLDNNNILILDLRSNSGGNLDETYKIIDLFIENNKTIAYENTRLKLFSKQIKTKNSKRLSYEKIYILQDINTASASEVLISALKQNLDNVITVGDKTFGKGIGQFTAPLKHGYALKLTTLKLLCPDKSSIHKKGIYPDIEYKYEDIIDYIIKNKPTPVNNH